VAPPVPLNTFLLAITAGNGFWDMAAFTNTWAWPSLFPSLFPSQLPGQFLRLFRRLERVQTDVLEVDTSQRCIVDLTDAVRRFCFALGDGLLNVFVPHATAGVAIIETGAGSDDDLVDTLERLLPRDDRYRHAHGSNGHGADHVLPAIVSPSVTLPVCSGEPRLGTWQSVVLVDLNRDNPQRSVRLSFLEG